MSQLFRLKNGTVLLSTEAPGGIYNSGQLKKIAELCSKELAIVKATEDQRLALFVKESEVERVAKELRAMGLGFRHYQDSLHQPVSCLGELCEEHEQPAMATAMDITKEIASIQLTAPLKIGINGCARCCTPCHTLDIAVVGDASGYRISLGGKTRQMPEFASYFAEGVPPKELPKRLKTVIETFKNLAEDGETLHDVIERCGVTDFVQALAPYSQDAAHREDPFAKEAEAGESLDDVALPADELESLDETDTAADLESEAPDMDLENNLAAEDDLSIADDTLDDGALEEIPIEKTGQGSLEDDLSLGNEDADLELNDLSLADEAADLGEGDLLADEPAEIGDDSLLADDAAEIGDDSLLADDAAEIGDDSLLADDAAEIGDDNLLADETADIGKDSLLADETAEISEESLDGDAGLEASDSLLDDTADLNAEISDDGLLDDAGLDTSDSNLDELNVEDSDSLTDENSLEAGDSNLDDELLTTDGEDLTPELDENLTLETEDASMETMDFGSDDVNLDSTAAVTEDDIDLDAVDLDGSDDALDVQSEADLDLDESMTLEDDIPEDLSVGDDLEIDDAALTAAEAPLDEDLEGIPELDEDLAPEELTPPPAKTPAPVKAPAAVASAPAPKAPAPKAPAEAALQDDFGEEIPGDMPELSDEEESQFEQKLHASIDEESRLLSKADKDPNVGAREAALSFLENSDTMDDEIEAIELDDAAVDEPLGMDDELEEISSDDELETISEDEPMLASDDAEKADEVLEPIQETMEEFPEPGPSELAHIKSRQLGQKLQGSAPRQQFKVSAITFQDEHMRVNFESGAYVDFDLSALGLGEERNFRLGVQSVSVTSTSEGYILEVDGMRLFHPKTSLPAAS
jgi:dissimilatory sulfite reductase (desulfoviridin) alpha/beta subunit